jgi:archaetidylinositol phosphate synthase
MLNKYREKVKVVLDKLAYIFDRAGIRPWIVSILGLIFIIIGSTIIIYNEELLWLFIIFISIGSLMDAIDGTLARIQNSTSRWGMFYDSFLDRLTEIIIFLTLLLVGYIKDYIAYLYISTAILISYARARGESLNINMRGIGLMERAERLLIIIVSLTIMLFIKYDYNYIASILIILNIITILQRTIHIYRTLST